MSPLEKEIIRRKLSVIVENLRSLEPIEQMSPEEYMGDLYKRKATERLLQELIEAAIDISTSILVQTGGKIPDDYYESFVALGELKIITPDLAQKLAPSAGLRNRLVHEYDTPEHALVLDSVRSAEGLYSRYVKQVEDYITKDLSN